MFNYVKTLFKLKIYYILKTAINTQV
jgi:hypothetical protein